MYMETKITDKIHDCIHVLTEKIKGIFNKKEVNNTEENKGGKKVKRNFFRRLFSFTYRRILKHKYMIIPVIVLFIAPIAITFVFGFEFINLPVKNVPTVIVNHDKSDTVNSLVEMIEENDAFNVIKYGDSEKDIQENMDNGTAMAGIYIPDNFSDDLLNGKDASILTYVDGSVTSPSSSVKTAISEIMGTIKSGYLMSLAEGKLGMTPQNAMNLISPMGYNYRFIGNPTKNMAYFMVEGITLNSIQIAAATVGAFISEKKSYLKLIGKGSMIGVLATISSFVCLYIFTKYFNIPYRGSLAGGALLSLFCNVGWVFFGILLNYSKKGNKLEAASSCGIVSMTMLFSGYTFPVLAMPSFFSKIVDYMPNTHFIIPLRDISLLGNTFNDVMPHIIWLVKFTLIMIGLATLQFLLSKLPKKKKEDKTDKKKHEKFFRMKLGRRKDDVEEKEVVQA